MTKQQAIPQVRRTGHDGLVIRLGPTIRASLQTAIGNEIYCMAGMSDNESTLAQWLTRS